jgi:hypothetical protein
MSSSCGYFVGQMRFGAAPLAPVIVRRPDFAKPMEVNPRDKDILEAYSHQ